VTALPKRDRQAERREATRREIVDAAWEIARTDGLAGVTLRAVAARVGMQSPSLYSHFESKNAIFDAMFGQAWADYLQLARVMDQRIPDEPRKAVLSMAQSFVDFSLADLARFQLMNLRMVPDFRPSEESYAPSLEVMRMLRERLAGFGIRSEAEVNLYLAIVSGIVDGQFANDPGGRRWSRLLPRAIDMYADEVGLPGPRLRRKP
jgi:AcrR family transcriptional regulator